MSWWVIISTPKGGGAERSVVELGDLADDELDAVLTALKAEYAIPGDWPERRHEHGEPWEFFLTQGEPHPSQLWSDSEIGAARERLEDAAGIPAHLAAIRTLSEQIEAVHEHLPPDVLQGLLDRLTAAKKALPKVGLDAVRGALEATPPSKATLKRKPRPSKDAQPTPGR